MSTTPEEFLGQILVDGQWVDYARGHEAESRLWQQADPKHRRVVDWINKSKVIVAPTPEPRAWTFEDLPKAENDAEIHNDLAGYYYAWGRIDQGHAPVARQATQEREPSGTSTTWLFGGMWMQAKRELDDPAHERRHLPSIDRAWENFAETGGHSLDDPRDR